MTEISTVAKGHKLFKPTVGVNAYFMEEADDSSESHTHRGGAPRKPLLPAATSVYCVLSGAVGMSPTLHVCLDAAPPSPPHACAPSALPTPSDVFTMDGAVLLHRAAPGQTFGAYEPLSQLPRCTVAVAAEESRFVQEGLQCHPVVLLPCSRPDAAPTTNVTFDQGCKLWSHPALADACKALIAMGHAGPSSSAAGSGVGRAEMVLLCSL